MSFTGHRLGNIDGLADAAKTVLEGKINVYELAAELTDEDASSFIAAALAAKEEGKSHFMFNGKDYPVTVGEDVAKQVEDKLDPVGKEDDDVDNDGDVDDSDEYLKKRRDAIDKAIDDEEEKEESVQEATEDKRQYSPKSNDEVAPGTDTGVESQEDIEVKDGEEEEAEGPQEFKTPFVKYEGVQGLVDGLVGISEASEIDEGKMKELHALVSKGIKDPKKIAKELGLKPSKDTFNAISSIIAGM